jgi:hypothetical protein
VSNLVSTEFIVPLNISVPEYGVIFSAYPTIAPLGAFNSASSTPL